MKTVSLTPIEHDDPSNEEHTVYSIALLHDRFTSLDEFFFASVTTGAFPKDERWYRKKPADPHTTRERLRSFEFPEIRAFLSEPITEAIVTVDDPMEFDCHVATSRGFMRVLSYSTA